MAVVFTVLALTLSFGLTVGGFVGLAVEMDSLVACRSRMTTCAGALTLGAAMFAFTVAAIGGLV